MIPAPFPFGEGQEAAGYRARVIADLRAREDDAKDRATRAKSNERRSWFLARASAYHDAAISWEVARGYGRR